MGKRELKLHHPELNISIIDIISKLHPKGSSKYIPLLIKEYKRLNTEFVKKYDEDYSYYVDNVKEYVDEDELKNLGYFDVKLLNDVIFNVLNFVDIDMINQHNEHHKNNRIQNPDISSYKGLDELYEQARIANIKFLEKEVSSSAHVVLDNDKWLIIKPLTFGASLKYGSATKWCTASKSNPHHFARYSRNGNLYYLINKEDSFKCAIYCEKPSPGDYVNHNGNFQIYNEADERTDSAFLNIESDVIKLILDDNKNYISNYDFIVKTYPNLVNEFDKLENIKESQYEPQPIEEAVPAPEVMIEEEDYHDNTVMSHTYDGHIESDFENKLTMFEKQLKHATKLSWYERIRLKLFGPKVVFVGVPVGQITHNVEYQQEIMRRLSKHVEDINLNNRMVFYPSSETNLVINKF